jgi:hypothetical protein
VAVKRFFSDNQQYNFRGQVDNGATFELNGLEFTSFDENFVSNITVQPGYGLIWTVTNLITS